MRCVLHGVSITLDQVDGVCARAQKAELLVNESGDGWDAVILRVWDGIKNLILLVIGGIFMMFAV